ncbi:MAG: hypothetical protein ABI596_01550 [Pyrinomonadaceae bacterium]
MRMNVGKLSFALCLIAGSAFVSYAQDQAAGKAENGKPATTTPISANVVLTAASTPMDLARAALAAQGGDNFRNMKSLVLIGDVDLYAPNSAQSVPGKFVIVYGDGARYRLDVQSPVVQFKQIYDGQQGYSSIPNLSVLNPSKFGLGLLTRLDQPGYTVTALPDKKKERAFRVSGGEGITTDFLVDAVTGRVMQFTAPFQGGVFAVEQKNMKVLDGILVPYTLTQRFETPQGAYFAEFKVKTAKVNQPLGDDVFVIQ